MLNKTFIQCIIHLEAILHLQIKIEFLHEKVNIFKQTQESDLPQLTFIHSIHRRFINSSMLPLSLLKAAENNPMLIELKNGDTYNGRLVSCNMFMNICLRDVICTSKVSGKKELFDSYHLFD